MFYDFYIAMQCYHYLACLLLELDSHDISSKCFFVLGEVFAAVTLIESMKSSTHLLLGLHILRLPSTTVLAHLNVL
uniref:Uncharacterized protein n=1 Tax=Arion vulgaris TaxID=1028688 RepID=A0A0B7AA04_9EUPU